MRRSTLNKLCKDLPATTRLTLVRTFDEMGTLASWICYGDNHAWLDAISVSAAQQLRDARPAVIRYFGGEEYIPDYEAVQPMITEILTHDEQGILNRY